MPFDSTQTVPCFSTASKHLAHSNTRNSICFTRFLHGSLDTGGGGAHFQSRFYPAAGADDEAFSICVNANCPQAAITSRPREYRVNTGTPRSSKIL